MQKLSFKLIIYLENEKKRFILTSGDTRSRKHIRDR